MFVMGDGINTDVENLTFAVLDHDDTALSRDYALQLAGSRYFTPAGGNQGLRGPRPAHDERRHQPGHRDPARASLATSAATGMSRSAPGSMAPCQHGERRCGAMCKACTRHGSRRRPARSTASRQWLSAFNGTRFRYNPAMESSAADGASRHSHAAADYGDAGGSQRRARRNSAPSSTSTSPP